jgi:1-acyl-sn-glycerol-3-phosphate acyltransferase
MPDTSAIRPLSFRRRPMQWFCRLLLPLIGWRVEGRLPDLTKFVIIVYPHTSNWDLPIGLICAYAIGLLSEWPYGFMVKDSALKWPIIGRIVRRLGGIGINRSATLNAVQQMAEVFRRADRLFVAITPEGTRKKTPYLKSGFYHIARTANIPIVLAYLDYKRRAGGLGPAILPTADVEADLERIRHFYARVTPLYPEQTGEIKFKANESQA